MNFHRYLSILFRDTVKTHHLIHTKWGSCSLLLILHFCLAWRWHQTEEKPLRRMCKVHFGNKFLVRKIQEDIQFL